MTKIIAKHPLRRVLERVPYTTRYNRHGEGGYHEKLECGHDWYGKRSAGSPLRRRCRYCFKAINNLAEAVRDQNQERNP